MADGVTDSRQARGLRRHIVPFTIGLATGAILTVAVFSIVVFQADLDRLRETMVYATGALAVDTERNAKKILGLEERLDDLEARLPKEGKRAK